MNNLFLVVDGMIRLGGRRSTTKEEALEVLSGRLQALAKANSLVRPSFNSAVQSKVPELSQLVETVLRPYGVPALDGEPVRLGERAVQSLALVFHELATNSAKYGALSAIDGKVCVSWRVTDGRVSLVWREQGGPQATSPNSEGFGSILIRNTVASFGGSISYDWKALAGLSIALDLPVDRMER